MSISNTTRRRIEALKDDIDSKIDNIRGDDYTTQELVDVLDSVRDGLSVISGQIATSSDRLQKALDDLG